MGRRDHLNERVPHRQGVTLGSHDKAAAAVTARLLRRERANLLAVGVFGSGARGEARRFSDLDILVVVRKRHARLRPEVLHGVLVTYHHLTAEEAREEVMGSGPWLNDTLGGWRSVQPRLDPKGLLRRWKRRAARPRTSQFDETPPPRSVRDLRGPRKAQKRHRRPGRGGGARDGPVVHQRGGGVAPGLGAARDAHREADVHRRTAPRGGGAGGLEAPL